MDTGYDGDRSGEGSCGAASPIRGRSEDETIILRETDHASVRGSTPLSHPGAINREEKEEEESAKSFDHASDDEDNTWSGSLHEIISLHDTTAFITVAFHDGTFGTRDIPVRYLEAVYPTELAEYQRSISKLIPAAAAAAAVTTTTTTTTRPIPPALHTDDALSSTSSSSPSSFPSSGAVCSSPTPARLSLSLAPKGESMVVDRPISGLESESESEWVMEAPYKRRKLQ